LVANPLKPLHSRLRAFRSRSTIVLIVLMVAVRRDLISLTAGDDDVVENCPYDSIYRRFHNIDNLSHGWGH